MLITKLQRDPETLADGGIAALHLPEEEVTTETLGNVQVIYGAAVQRMPLAGLTIAEAREISATILNVERRAPALLNGELTREARVIVAGDTLEFVHHAGEKGCINGCENRDRRQ